jgi:hypothetical protein
MAERAPILGTLLDSCQLARCCCPLQRLRQTLHGHPESRPRHNRQNHREADRTALLHRAVAKQPVNDRHKQILSGNLTLSNRLCA